MSDDPRLLVVDDEEAICEGCRRIFSRQGFQVEKSSDAVEGLALASDRDYAAILLDIKMPNMDGIAFLEQLRSKKPRVPVILMTGYPSVPNAVSAIRLGAAGYITKPFTPEEISQAVHKFLGEQAGTTTAASEQWVPSVDGFYFWNEAWLHRGQDAAVRVGGMISRPGKAKVTAVKLPKIGEVVYQGLPMAEVVIEDKPSVIIPAPISGVVVAYNEALSQNPGQVLDDPCGQGWMATVSPTRLDDELPQCTRRSVALYSADADVAAAQKYKLESLGCQVRVISRWDELVPALKSRNFPVLLMEASTSAAEGPAMVGQINLLAPSVKVVLLASPDCKLEAAYRARKIFYYAVEPFADNEIAEILDAAFRPHIPPTKAERPKAGSSAISSITITNRNGRKIKLLAESGLLYREEGLGAEIRKRLLDKLFPVESTAGESKVNPSDILAAAVSCDHLVVVLTRDANRIPGSLLRDTKSEFVSVSGEGAGKVTTLVVQTDPATGAPAVFDGRITAMLAEHIVADMASY